MVQLNVAHGGRNGMHTGYMNLSLIFNVAVKFDGVNLDWFIFPAKSWKEERNPILDISDPHTRIGLFG